MDTLKTDLEKYVQGTKLEASENRQRWLEIVNGLIKATKEEEEEDLKRFIILRVFNFSILIK